MRLLRNSIMLAFLGITVFVSPVQAEMAYSVGWVRQFGTSTGDYGYRISVDNSGNSYVAGETSGLLGGAHYGGRDAFLSKYDSTGSHQWTQQLGTSTDDGALGGASLDGIGNVYMSGYTTGLLGDTSYGSHDAFVAKYNTSGSPQWSTPKHLALQRKVAPNTRSHSAQGQGSPM